MIAAPTLRPYQEQAITAVRARFLAGDRATLIVLPTGTGKTVVFAEIARLTVARGHRALVLAHRTELLEQALAKLRAVGVDAAIEQADRRGGAAAVVVASVQTLRGDRLSSWPADAFDLVIIDEAHHATAATYRAIVDRFETARVLGVTATPDRGDGKGLGPIFQSVAFTYGLGDAIRAGFLAPIRAQRINLDLDLDAVKTTAGDLDQQQLGVLMTAPAVIEATSRALVDSAGTRPTIAFTVTVHHAQLLADACHDLKPGSARAVSGKSTPEERAAAAADLAAGRVQIVANAALWTEGFDCPPVACIAIARPTKSRALFTQMVGRGTRPSPATGKTNLLVLDFAGLTRRHKLVSTIDVLLGTGLTDEERRRVLEATEQDPADLEAELLAVRAQLAAAQRAPTIRWMREECGDLLGLDVDPALFGPGLAPVSEVSRVELAARGIVAPPGLSDLAASAIIAASNDRSRRNLATFKMVRFMSKTLGVPLDLARTLTFPEAGRVIGELKSRIGHYAALAEARTRVLAELSYARATGGRRAS